MSKKKKIEFKWFALCFVALMLGMAACDGDDSDDPSGDSDADSDTDSETDSDSETGTDSDTGLGYDCHIVIIVSVDWEGRDLDPVNIAAFESFREMFPEIPMLQFLNAAYFTKPDANVKEVTDTIQSVLLPIDEHGLHIHGWKTLFEAAGVVHHTSPTWWWGDELTEEDCEYDCGHEIAISDYTQEELEQVIQYSQEVHTAAGFDEAMSFRTGGWMGTENVLEALAAEGFEYDNSSVPTELIDDELPDDVLIFGWLEELWADITTTSQPYEILEGLTEVPDNGCLADYMSGNDMLQVFIENTAHCKDDPEGTYYVSIGFHQETASTYLGRLTNGINQITEYAAAQGITLEFQTRPY